MLRSAVALTLVASLMAVAVGVSVAEIASHADPPMPTLPVLQSQR